MVGQSCCYEFYQLLQQMLWRLRGDVLEVGVAARGRCWRVVPFSVIGRLGTMMGQWCGLPIPLVKW